MEDVYVILWSYTDGSGNGVVRVYIEKKSAEEDLEILQNHCTDKAFEIFNTPYKEN